MDYIQNFIPNMQDSPTLPFGHLSNCMLWSLLLISLIVLWGIEFVLKKLLKRMNNDENELRKIFQAIESCNTIEVIRLLQKDPIYVNCRLGSHNYTPFLVRNTTILNLMKPMDLTFQVACYHGNTLLVKYMLQMNADIKRKTKYGETPFYLAVAHLINNPFSIDASCIRELFYAGCDVNEPNAKGFTPLHLAAYFGHRTLVKWLLEKGANPRVSPSPVELASNQGIWQQDYLNPCQRE